MHLIVGLGNPGEEYRNSRHNLGFRVVDELASRLGVRHFKSKFRSLIAEANLNGQKIILSQPQTFMNLSGESVRDIFDFYKIPKNHMIVIYDDLDLDVGKLRIREKGASGGHKGVDSVINCLKTGDFARVRIGIGRPTNDLTEDASDYVLENIPSDEEGILQEAVYKAADAVLEILRDGLTSAMNEFNQ